MAVLKKQEDMLLRVQSWEAYPPLSWALPSIWTSVCAQAAVVPKSIQPGAWPCLSSWTKLVHQAVYSSCVEFGLGWAKGVLVHDQERLTMSSLAWAWFFWGLELKVLKSSWDISASTLVTSRALQTTKPIASTFGMPVIKPPRFTSSSLSKAEVKCLPACSNSCRKLGGVVKSISFQLCKEVTADHSPKIVNEALSWCLCKP